MLRSHDINLGYCCLIYLNVYSAVSLFGHMRSLVVNIRHTTAASCQRCGLSSAESHDRSQGIQEETSMKKSGNH